MTDVHSYPYLQDLLGEYFHQDAFLEGDIMRDFKSTSRDYQRYGVRADIRRLIHEHEDDLVDAMEKLFSPDVIFGNTNAEARAWLLRLDAVLD